MKTATFAWKYAFFMSRISTGGVEVAGSNPVSPILLDAENECIFNRPDERMYGKVRRSKTVLYRICSADRNRTDETWTI